MESADAAGSLIESAVAKQQQAAHKTSAENRERRPGEWPPPETAAVLTRPPPRPKSGCALVGKSHLFHKDVLKLRILIERDMLQFCADGRVGAIAFGQVKQGH